MSAWQVTGSIRTKTITMKILFKNQRLEIIVRNVKNKTHMYSHPTCTYMMRCRNYRKFSILFQMIVVLRNLVLKCSRPCCEVRMISSTKCINQKKNSTFDNVTSNRNKSLFDKLRTRHGRRIIARKLEGLPSESEAPHLKCVFASNLDSYALLSSPTNWCMY